MVYIFTVRTGIVTYQWLPPPHKGHYTCSVLSGVLDNYTQFVLVNNLMGWPGECVIAGIGLKSACIYQNTGTSVYVLLSTSIHVYIM